MKFSLVIMSIMSWIKDFYSLSENIPLGNLWPSKNYLTSQKSL